MLSNQQRHFSDFSAECRRVFRRGLHGFPGGQHGGRHLHVRHAAVRRLPLHPHPRLARLDALPLHGVLRIPEHADRRVHQRSALQVSRADQAVCWVGRCREARYEACYWRKSVGERGVGGDAQGLFGWMLIDMPSNVSTFGTDIYTCFIVIQRPTVF